MSDQPAEPAYIPPRRRRDRNRAAVIGGVLAVLVASLLTVLVVRYASRQPDKVNLPGGDTFPVGSAEHFAKVIDRQQTPLLFKDPLTSSARNEIWVLHDGEDVKEGWFAVSAYVPGVPRTIRCALQWDRDHQGFTSPCTDATFAPDDSRLTRYPGTVNANGIVEINLRAATP